MKLLVPSFASFDEYERKARVFPALLVMLPLVIPVLWGLGPKSPMLTALLLALSGCGATYCIASIARSSGKSLEEKLFHAWGGKPTTLILRHRDHFLDTYSKRRYHEEIEAKLGVKMPSAEEETGDPKYADEIYEGAIRKLREATRGKTKSLLHRENISYGFHRNMMALRRLGSITCLMGSFVGLAMYKETFNSLPSFSIPESLHSQLGGMISIGISLMLLFVWRNFHREAVKNAAYCYAERLLEELTHLPKKRKTTLKI